MDLKTMVDIAQIVTAFGVLVMLWQVVVMVRQFNVMVKQVDVMVWQVKADHDKSRREYSARLIWDWTTNIRKNTKATTKLINLLDKTECAAIFNQNAFKLDCQHEPLLRAVLSGTELTFKTTENGSIVIDEAISSYMRSMVTNYLNLLESVFVAWHHNVGDKDIIDEQFRFMISPEGNTIFLKDYLVAAGGTKNYPMIYEYIAHLNDKYGPTGGQRSSPA